MVLTSSDLKDAYEGFARAVEHLDRQHELILKLRADRRDTHDAEVDFGTMRRTLLGNLGSTQVSHHSDNRHNDRTFHSGLTGWD